MNRFDKKTVIVTGAASGIGAACVRRQVSEGDGGQTAFIPSF